MGTTASFSKFHQINIAALTLVLFVLMIITVVPSFRFGVRELFLDPQREVLAALSADVGRTGKAIRVIKVAEGDRIFVEIYEENLSQGAKRLDRKQLVGNKNAYFTFRGESTSLALSDLDDDGILEIITPSFENGLVARMSVFKFQPQSQSLLELKNVPLPGEREHLD